MAAAPALRRSPRRKSGGEASAGHPRKGSPCTPGTGSPHPPPAAPPAPALGVKVGFGAVLVLVFTRVRWGCSLGMLNGARWYPPPNPTSLVAKGSGLGEKRSWRMEKSHPDGPEEPTQEDVNNFPRLSPPRGLSGRPVGLELCPSPRERGRGGTRPKDGGAQTRDKASTTG